MAEWVFLIGACLLAVFDTIAAQGQALLPARVLVAIALASKILRWVLALVKNMPTAIPNWKSALLALMLALVPSIGGRYGGNLLSSASIPGTTSDVVSGDNQGLAIDAVQGHVGDALEEFGTQAKNQGGL
jgi:hypothetical protein